MAFKSLNRLVQTNGILTVCAITLASPSVFGLADTVGVCERLAKQAEKGAIAKVQVVQGPFKNNVWQKVDKGCSFSASLKPGESHEIEVFGVHSTADWSELWEYRADGHGSGSYALYRGDTVCFISFHSGGLDDSATEEQIRAYPPQPTELIVKCTDVDIFNKISPARSQGFDRSEFRVTADPERVKIFVTDSRGRQAAWDNGSVQRVSGIYRLELTGVNSGPFQINIRSRTFEGIIKPAQMLSGKIEKGQVLEYSVQCDPITGDSQN